MTVKIAPTPGRLVPMHDRSFEPLPVEGADVIIDTVYQRYLDTGDAYVIPPEKAADPAPNFVLAKPASKASTTEGDK